MYKIMKRLFFLQLLLCMSSLYTHNNRISNFNSEEDSFSAFLHQEYKKAKVRAFIAKKLPKIVESTVDFVKKHPVISTALVTGITAWGIYYCKKCWDRSKNQTLMDIYRQKIKTM